MLHIKVDDITFLHMGDDGYPLKLNIHLRRFKGMRLKKNLKHGYNLTLHRNSLDDSLCPVIVLVDYLVMSGITHVIINN